jgi:hypothetical protein
MILSHRHKTDRSPERNFTEAACDVCKSVCAESRVTGTRGDKVWQESQRLALANGWVERTVKDPWTPRKRGPTWTIKLLCPECQMVEPEQPR